MAFESHSVTSPLKDPQSSTGDPGAVVPGAMKPLAPARATIIQHTIAPSVAAHAIRIIVFTRPAALLRSPADASCAECGVTMSSPPFRRCLAA